VKVYDPVSSKGHLPFNSKFCESIRHRITKIYGNRDAFNYFAWSGVFCDSTFFRNKLTLGSSFLRHLRSFANIFDDEQRLILSFENRFLFILFLPITRNDRLYLVFHNNAPGFERSNKLIRWFVKRSLSGVNAIFLAKSQSAVYSDIQFTSSCVSGIPIETKNNYQTECAKEKYILWGAKRHADLDLLRELVSSERLLDILGKHNLKFIVRGDSVEPNKSELVSFIHHWLSDVEYRRLLNQAQVVIIKYDDSYVAKASSFLVDVLEGPSQLLLYESDEFLEFYDLLGKGSYFKDHHDLCDKLEVLIGGDIKRHDHEGLVKLENERLTNLEKFLDMCK